MLPTTLPRRRFREGSGMSPDLAADGEEGLAHALDGQYDVLIVDRIAAEARRPERQSEHCAARALRRPR